MNKNENNYTNIGERQGYVSKSGYKWELEVMDFLNKEFLSNNIPLKAIHGKKIKKNSNLWDKLAIPVGEGKTVRKIEGDVDLVIVHNNNPEEPLAVISCKTSLHGRLTETLFYAVVWKQMLPKIFVFFSTPDKGRQNKKDSWSSEWGSKENPTKDRLLAEHFLNGVYIKNKKTKLGGKIKELSNLPKDLKNLLLK